MRRKDREITDSGEILKILSACDCCRLGLTDENGAYIVPMNFGISTEGDKITLYFHSAREGRKIELIKKNSSVAFEADCSHALKSGETYCDYSYYYESVMGRGIAEIITDEEEKLRGLTVLSARYAPSARPAFSPAAVKAVTVIKLTVTEISGKSNRPAVGHADKYGRK